jgi:hypothetical protein
VRRLATVFGRKAGMSCRGRLRLASQAAAAAGRFDRRARVRAASKAPRLGGQIAGRRVGQSSWNGGLNRAALL